MDSKKSEIGKLLQKKEAPLINFLGNKENALRFMSSVMHTIQKCPELLNCDQNSLLGAFMECAAINLYPGSYSGECYVLPYNGMAQFQLGYKGVRTLAYRSGILRCGAEIVYENDEFERVLGTTQELIHKPSTLDRERPIGVYAWAEVKKGAMTFEYMTKDEVMKIKEKSKSKGSKYSPWNPENDPMLWMWKKTVFKQLGKMLPSDDRMSKAIHIDSVCESGGYFKDEGEVIEIDIPEDKVDLGNDKKEKLRKNLANQSSNE